MKEKLLNHIYSIFFVFIPVAAFIFYYSGSYRNFEESLPAELEPFLSAEFFNPDDPSHRQLLAEFINYYYSDKQQWGERVVSKLESFRQEEFLKNRDAAKFVRGKLTTAMVSQIFGLFSKFLFIFFVVMILLLYFSINGGLLKFILAQRSKPEPVTFKKSISIIYGQLKQNKYLTAEQGRLLFSAVKSFGRVLLYVLLFSPAYVIAYSFKNDFSNNSTMMMILLGFLTNGLLINYVNKFYGFLMAENKKNYVLLLRVKNLNCEYNFDFTEFRTIKYLFSFNKKFSDHILGAIYKNALFQYFHSIKELAAFTVSGLIIIEMALNIQGHLSYEMLKYVLNRNYDTVFFIVMLIFILIKLIEISVDYYYERLYARYSNNK